MQRPHHLLPMPIGPVVSPCLPAPDVVCSYVPVRAREVPERGACHHQSHVPRHANPFCGAPHPRHRVCLWGNHAGAS